ncbi:Serine/threonine-protein phosphatase 6 regulatory subunit 1 [Bos mutus]|uniref:Serine/threonine-protein phosphatase 6 regulatory subunit 1 n=1 Tax=Bos mutus TaxID=72004 RepID=L8I383_9CETA|nr:Serine/threonine-protein phosphatase 6 regulatory subunit 1 [Bos mutus]
MFWKFDLHTSSHLDTLLEREDLSLPELLDEEDVLQECKVVNRKLLDFLLRPLHLQAMPSCQVPLSQPLSPGGRECARVFVLSFCFISQT